MESTRCEEPNVQDQIVIKVVKVEVHIFRIDAPKSDNDLEMYAKQLGLTLVDWQFLAGIKKTRPNFAGGHPVGTHWKDEKELWHHLAVDSPPKINGSCFHNGVWSTKCWFAGIPIPESVD